MHNIVTGYAPSTLKFNFHSNKNRHSHKLIVPRPRLDLFKCSFDTTGIGKENRSSQCLSYKGGGGWGRDHSHKQSEGSGGVLWVYKVGLKERERERGGVAVEGSG